MVNSILNNCIGYLQRVTPEMLLAALLSAIIVTAAARLVLVPLAYLVNKGPRWLSLILDILLSVCAVLLSGFLLYLFAAAGFRRVDPDTVLAARTLGMKNRVIRRKVIRPQARKWITAGTILCFVKALIEAFMIAILCLSR